MKGAAEAKKAVEDSELDKKNKDIMSKLNEADK